jgi:hypothetical protein
MSPQILLTVWSSVQRPRLFKADSCLHPLLLFLVTFSRLLSASSASPLKPVNQIYTAASPSHSRFFFFIVRLLWGFAICHFYSFTPLLQPMMRILYPLLKDMIWCSFTYEVLNHTISESNSVAAMPRSSKLIDKWWLVCVNKVDKSHVRPHIDWRRVTGKKTAAASSLSLLLLC